MSLLKTLFKHWMFSGMLHRNCIVSTTINSRVMDSAVIPFSWMYSIALSIAEIPLCTRWRQWGSYRYFETSSLSIWKTMNFRTSTSNSGCRRLILRVAK
ncbi:hypothetical protein CsatB_016933 [Cannabis sativa]